MVTVGWFERRPLAGCPEGRRALGAAGRDARAGHRPDGGATFRDVAPCITMKEGS
jgi:hypothetical protein